MTERIPYEAGCPFFQRFGTNGYIYCEACRMKWPDKKSREKALRALCRSDEGCKNCMFYKILDEYYGRLYSATEEPKAASEKMSIETPAERKERLLKEQIRQHEEYMKGLQKRIRDSYRKEDKNENAN